MAYYLTQASYSPEAWKAQTQNPQHRSQQISGLLEAAGGRLIGLYFAFGEYDLVTAKSDKEEEKKSSSDQFKVIHINKSMIYRHETSMKHIFL